MKTCLQRGPARRTPTLAALLLCALSVSLAPVAPAAAQSAPEPRREQLLNGLRLLIVSRPGDQNVLLRLRVHSGAAFDLADKEGLAAMLADALFDEGTRQFVREDLDGRLEVATGYDSIDVTLGGRATDFERFVDLLRNALTNTQLTPDVVTKLRDAHLKSVREAAPPPSARADRAAAARLFGKHPYGRTIEGTPESVARVERADLMLARDRFLNPNNTTLVIVGGVEPRVAMRLMRQNLGAWTKSDRVIPATFRQPEAPDARTLVIDGPGAAGVEVRLAVRGLARADRDAPAAHVLATVVAERWRRALSDMGGKDAGVGHDTYTESGLFLLSATVPNAAAAAKALDAGRGILADLASKGPTTVEFENTKLAVAGSLLNPTKGDEAFVTDLLDEHTYKTPSVKRGEVARAINALTPAEAQRVAARLFLHAPVATVAVGEAARLSEELSRAGGVQLHGAKESAPAAQQTTTTTTTTTAKPPVQLKRP